MKRSVILGFFALALVAACAAYLIYDLSPVNASENGQVLVFEIKQGDGFRYIAGNLYNAGLIRSAFAFETYSLLGGKAFQFKPGLYRLNPAMGASTIVAAISGSGAAEVKVTIPEGSNRFDIDRILSDALVLRRGEFVGDPTTADLEGKLFPDTYEFYTNAKVADVITVLTDTWNTKAAPLFANDENAARDLVIASIVEKEVPLMSDREVIAGILLKRLAAGVALNVDATVCYAKFAEHPTSTQNCYPLTPLDFKIDSPYNTYLYKGLPPRPIGNPGISAITAALNPQSSPYWYYLSDPKTGATIFAKTLGEQEKNIKKYLTN